MPIEQFRKYPIRVEAILWDGTNIDEIQEWCKDAYLPSDEAGTVIIQTLEGNMAGHVGDWIVKGAVGEFYPVKPDAFTATFGPWSSDPLETGVTYVDGESWQSLMDDLDAPPDPEQVSKLRKLFEENPPWSDNVEGDYLEASKRAVELAAKYVEQWTKENPELAKNIDLVVNGLSVSEELPSIEEVKDTLHIFIITTKTFPEVESHDDEIAIEIMKAYVDGRLVEKGTT